ncbi:MAG: DUF488 family protein, partial [Eubacteriales bacterium]|nr:DUF488 family protein [Eubacteriales bacterium]
LPIINYKMISKGYEYMAGKLIMIRAYDIDDTCQGRRILVDRLWPRGIKKESLEPFEWAKEITPSTQIRKFFAHKAENFEKFSKLYLEELEGNPEAEKFKIHVKNILKTENAILIYAAKDPEINHVQVLKKFLQE